MGNIFSESSFFVWRCGWCHLFYEVSKCCSGIFDIWRKFASKLQSRKSDRGCPAPGRQKRSKGIPLILFDVVFASCWGWILDWFSNDFWINLNTSLMMFLRCSSIILKLADLFTYAPCQDGSIVFAVSAPCFLMAFSWFPDDSLWWFLLHFGIDFAMNFGSFVDQLWAFGQSKCHQNSMRKLASGK